MTTNNTCSRWLGEYVAEQVLAKSFEHVIKMPNNNPGFDFICGKGNRIDVKSSCTIISTRSWKFNINKNCIAEYFLCLAFDNRETLNPLHVWLIPSYIINNKVSFTISSSKKSLLKWSLYEQSLDKVLLCCEHMKESNQKL